jgi:hypothetical protein
MEYMYYALAFANSVPMPTASILEIEAASLWGMEVLDGRNQLAPRDKLPDALRTEIRQSFVDYVEERDSFLRASFLDVMLLNADRGETNTLCKKDGGRLRLFYLDHETSFGWRNQKDNDEENRIQAPEKEYERLDASYGKFVR